MKKKIALITLNYPPLIIGGASLSAYHIAKGLSKDYEVEVFTAKITKGNKSQNTGGETKDWDLPNVKIHRIFSTNYSGIINEYTRPGIIAEELWDYLENECKYFDILYAYGMNTIPAVNKCREYADKTMAHVNGSWATSQYYHIDWKGDEYLRHGFCENLYDSIMRLFSSKDITTGRWKLAKILLSPLIWFLYENRLNELKEIDQVIPISNRVREILLASGIKGKLRVCHNMFEKSDKFDPKFIEKKFKIKNKKIILFSGRLAKIKGCHTIIKAMPKILKKNPDTHLLFAGLEADKKEMEELVKELNLQNNVTFGGLIGMNQKNLNSLYKGAYLTVYPSIFSDPFPRTPVESMIAGTPVIATGRGGIKDIIKDQKTGLIIPADNEKKLAFAVNKLLKDKKLYNKLKKNGIKISRKFIIKEGIKEYIKVIEDRIK